MKGLNICSKMTLHDMEDKLPMGPECGHTSSTVWPAIRSAMTRAYTDNRLTCGVVDCARQLEKDPDRVMLCLLPETIDQNVSIRIQHTLMEAYCRENGIPVIKVETKTAVNEMLKIAESTTRKLSNTSSPNTHARLERKTSNPRDFNCFLITEPEECSADEKKVKHICEAYPGNKAMIIEIPS